MATSPHSPLISTEELAAAMAESPMRIIDASWWLDGRDAHADYMAQRIPGAVFFDVDGISDPDSPYPHMLPSPDAFAKAVGSLGIGEADDIVVYDAQGLFSAARVWWSLRVMGAKQVRVLDGGLPKWKAEGRPLENGPVPAAVETVFTPDFDAEMVADTDVVRAALDQSLTVLDARGAPRFKGEAAEPRAGVRSGHMPGALNLPFGHLLEADGTLKRGEALKAAFTGTGLKLGQPVITTCGSGVTAAILSLGLAELGLTSRLYDGSWTEWGSRSDTPVVTG